MKVLLAGDTHGRTSHIITLLDRAVAEGCDCVFVLGDFGAWEHFASGVKFFDDVNRHATIRDVPVYWLDGNHDKVSLVLEKYADSPNSEGFLVCRPYVRYAPRGHRWEWAGKKFIALGGAYSIDKDYRLWLENAQGLGSERHWFPEEEMTEEELRDYLNADSTPVDFMLTHDKPRASKPSWNRKDIPDCWPNQDRIQRAVETLLPKELFHGHLHHHYEDTITYDDGAVQDITHVTGLDADPSTAERFYRVENSWYVLDLSNNPTGGTN
jgi:predicted phosphodiesterase